MRQALDLLDEAADTTTAGLGACCVPCGTISGSSPVSCEACEDGNCAGYRASQVWTADGEDGKTITLTLTAEADPYVAPHIEVTNTQDILATHSPSRTSTGTPRRRSESGRTHSAEWPSPRPAPTYNCYPVGAACETLRGSPSALIPPRWPTGTFPLAWQLPDRKRWACRSDGGPASVRVPGRRCIPSVRTHGWFASDELDDCRLVRPQRRPSCVLKGTS